jgi:SAM-dependent methyltransferase
LHPQWFVFYRQARELREICGELEGLVADIGCADSRPRQYLPASARYLGIDYYPTARDWYRTQPDLYADARALPLEDNSIDHTLLLDVLEHVPDPDCCLAEIHRTLKPGGSLTIQVPFLYPVHDAPLDFHRWTRFGLLAAAARHGFAVERETVLGHPLESAALNANIALSRSVFNWLKGWNILAVTAVLLPILVPAFNALAWGAARLSKPDPLMPHGYRMVWIKD